MSDHWLSSLSISLLPLCGRHIFLKNYQKLHIPCSSSSFATKWQSRHTHRIQASTVLSTSNWTHPMEQAATNGCLDHCMKATMFTCLNTDTKQLMNEPVMVEQLRPINKCTEARRQSSVWTNAGHMWKFTCRGLHFPPCPYKTGSRDEERGSSLNCEAPKRETYLRV